MSIPFRFWCLLGSGQGGAVSPPNPRRAQVNPRPAGGGDTPCPFPSIAQKRKGIELLNFQNPLLHQFSTCWPKQNFAPVIGQPWMASEWRLVSANKWQKSVILLVNSDDLDLRKGHLGLRTMLRYVTKRIMSIHSCDYASILGIFLEEGQ